MKAHNKLDFFKVINIILMITGCIGFILPFIILHKPDNAENINTVIPLSSIVGYCRFLVAGKNQMFFDIAIHNIAIAIFGFVISFFSRGVLGCLILFFNLFVLGTVLFSVHTVPTIIFVLLELIGICVSVFGGTHLSSRVIKNNSTTKEIFKSSLVAIIIIVVVYFIAAIIESKIILNQWG